MTNNTTDFDTRVMETNDLLWLPGVLIGLLMVIFLGLSFLSYHRKFLRKQKLALEYASLDLNVKRPRIAVCLCATHTLPFHELASLANASGRQNPEGEAHVCEDTNDNSVQRGEHTIHRDISKSNGLKEFDNNDIHYRKCNEPSAFFNTPSQKCIGDNSNDTYNRKCNDVTEFQLDRDVCSQYKTNPEIQNKYDCQDEDGAFGFTNKLSAAGYSNTAYVADHDEIEMQQLDICPCCGYRRTSDLEASARFSPDSRLARSFPSQGDEHIVQDAFHKPLRYIERAKVHRAPEKKS
ncbi:uncharacterized protein LOC121387694 isoform X2 [Gigantopelta aegis]|uniref:uncharacterized protein LOC121387694 isoform X2 n=1 Tax=Gigantopelta aegis TaxID=1735272 RepID=UPI001B88CCA9|nr:uncharacterized protein LOC121387694 isoform X2 [Gigantopelta aegis]